MKKTINKISFLLLTLLPNFILARDSYEEAFDTTYPGGTNVIPRNDILELINPVITTILEIAATIAVLMIIIGGLQYITAAGNPETIQKSKNTITYAVLGLIAAILGYALITFINNIF